MLIAPRNWVIFILVLWLPPQGLAYYVWICPDSDAGMETTSTDTAKHDHDCCDEPSSCQQLDCEHCSQCGVAAGAGAVGSAYLNQFPSLKDTIIPSQAEFVTSGHKDVPFKPPRRS